MTRLNVVREGDGPIVVLEALIAALAGKKLVGKERDGAYSEVAGSVARPVAFSVAIIMLDLARANSGAYHTGPVETATFNPPLAQAIADREGELAPGRYRLITVRDGKGGRDRITMLPINVASLLKRHLAKVRMQHEEDLAEGFGEVYLPDALERKYRGAARSWVWQFVFPSSRIAPDPRSITSG